MTSSLLSLKRDPNGRPITELPPEGYGATCEVPPASDELGAEELRVLLGSGAKVQLLDVREDWERALGSIEPSVHVPLGRLASGPAQEIAGMDPNAPTVIYCAAGVRSLHALRILRERHGFREAFSLRGGMRDWRV
jgi:adenylyltransferase/sulfurtransferase